MSPWLTADRKDGNGSDGCSDEVALSHISDSATLNSIDGCGDKNDEDDDGIDTDTTGADVGGGGSGSTSPATTDDDDGDPSE